MGVNGYTRCISNLEVIVSRTTLFQTNKTQAVRLSRAMAFPDSVREVTILRDGVRRVIVPADAVWDDFFDAPGVELGKRDQPAAQVREAF